MLFADEMSTLISGNVTHGGYGGPVLKFTEMNGSFGTLVGGHGGWIIDHKFVLGGGGYGLANDISVDLGPDTDKYLNFGYGGLELGYIACSNRLVHLDFNALIAGGGVGYRNSVFDDDWDDCDCYDWDCDYCDDWDDDCNEFEKPVFVVEPTVNLMLNVSKHVRVGVGASYRYVTGLKNLVIDNNDLSGGSISLNVKFGAF